jgi:hypothetical protein
MRLHVRSRWDGSALDHAAAEVELVVGNELVTIAVLAPLRGDPAPEVGAGPCPRLWEYEVVEIFLLGDDERYLEVELGPHGHYLALSLRGRRQIVAEHTIEYVTLREGARWRGQASFSRELAPAPLRAVNAHAIFGPKGARVHASCVPGPGPAPDFHRLECFASFAPDGVAG